MSKTITKLKRSFSAGWKLVKRARKSPFFRAHFLFARQYKRNAPLNENGVLIQAYEGKNLLGNPYYLLKALVADEASRHLQFYVVSDAKYFRQTQATIDRLMCPRIRIVRIFSRDYCKLLVSCKYLVNNATFPSFFIKRAGQVYLNTWHGTPLKHLGRKIVSAPEEIGNTQRNMLMADYLLYPNMFTFDVMRRDYMLEQMFTGKYVVGPYPRNSVFFDNCASERVRAQIGCAGKRVVVYMPTWRGTLFNRDIAQQCDDVTEMLEKLDGILDENTIVLAKMHYLVSANMNFDRFRHIRPFPSEFETYEIVNVADCLVTDYSSVFFDFANTGRKIILFAYDCEAYEQERGMYMSIGDLPFPIVATIEELAQEIRNPEYEDYSDFRDKYCTYDCADGAKKICDLVFHEQADVGVEVIESEQYSNHKEKVLIMPGTLKKNGITTAFLGILNSVELDDRNYCVLFYRKFVSKNRAVINAFPKQVAYIPMQGSATMTFCEAIAQALYFRMNLQSQWILKKLNSIFDRENARLFPGIHFDYAIHFSGYERKVMQIFCQMRDTERIVFVHNDMEREYKTKANFHLPSVQKAYREFDRVVPVREGMEQFLHGELLGTDPKKIHVVHNLNDIAGIREKATHPLTFDVDTSSNVEIEALEEILSDESNLIFVNIARYSVEKGLDRLIEAFSAIRRENEHAYLIIVGGYGNQYGKIRKMAEMYEDGHIVLIRSLQNPFPILKRADAFVLSSLHEGLPMTIMESLILGVPVISTDIEGPAAFLRQGYGSLVENSTQGIEQGMRAFAHGELHAEKPFDAEQFNDMALKEFNALFERSTK